MFDNLSAYYHDNVVTAFVEYRDVSTNKVAGRSADIRAALNAASALFHLREHLPNAPTRASVERECPDYGVLGDVTNASKHKVLTGSTPHGAPVVNDAANLQEQISLIEYTDSDGKFYYCQKNVVVKLIDGTDRNLLDVLTNVLNFWEIKMAERGVIPAARVFTHDAHIRVRSRSECGADSCGSGRLDLAVVQGNSLKQELRFLRFDEATGTTHPIDLTGCAVTANIYAVPPTIVDLTLRDPLGNVVTAGIPLSREEEARLAGLTTDDERRAFIAGLPAAKAAAQKLANEMRELNSKPDSA